MVEAAPTAHDPPALKEEPSKQYPEKADSIPESHIPAGPLFQSHDAASETSESEDEMNLGKTNNDWAALMLQLDDLRIAAGGAKAKGRKMKGPAVVLETPQMRELQGRISKLEKEYMFSKKDAGKRYELLDVVSSDCRRSCLQSSESQKGR